MRLPYGRSGDNNGFLQDTHYPVPMHLQGALVDLGYGPGDFPVAEKAASEILSLPLFPGITPDEQEWVVEKLEMSLEVAKVGAHG